MNRLAARWRRPCVAAMQAEAARVPVWADAFEMTVVEIVDGDFDTGLTIEFTGD